jgi:hypothetical protein
MAPLRGAGSGLEDGWWRAWSPWPQVPLWGGVAVSGLSGGTGPGPIISGPIISGPIISGPIISGPIISGPIIPPSIMPAIHSAWSVMCRVMASACSAHPSPLQLMCSAM